MQLFDDYRTHNLKDRIAGRWFIKNRTPFKVGFETIGRSMALSLRVLLRKNIGIESFSFWMAFWGLIWIRLCLVINAHEPESKEGANQLFNPLMFTDLGTGFLNVFSWFYIGSMIWFVYRTEFPSRNKPFVNVLSGGESVPLNPIINSENWYQKKAFVQSVIAPVLGLMLGYILLKLQQIGIGYYFLVSSIALLIDEVNHHRADIRYERIIKSKLFEAKRRRGQLGYDDFDNII